MNDILSYFKRILDFMNNLVSSKTPLKFWILFSYEPNTFYVSKDIFFCIYKSLDFVLPKTFLTSYKSLYIYAIVYRKIFKV